MEPIHVDPEILGGKPCFAGTRVPVKTLFDYLAHGRTLDEFITDFPTVSHDQTLTVLGLAGEKLVEAAVPAPAA